MARIELSPQARRDLNEIFDHVSLDDFNAAVELVLRIEDVIQLLGEQPEVGRARPELAENLRYFPVDRYLVFYTYGADLVFVQRVLHAARDIPALFE